MFLLVSIFVVIVLAFILYRVVRFLRKKYLNKEINKDFQPESDEKEKKVEKKKRKEEKVEKKKKEEEQVENISKEQKNNINGVATPFEQSTNVENTHTNIASYDDTNNVQNFENSTIIPATTTTVTITSEASTYDNNRSNDIPLNDMFPNHVYINDTVTSSTDDSLYENTKTYDAEHKCS